tara:strand:+ start:1969 stop:2232 length:264 start_codon:yes stop_codon:yes gene_type:complete
MKLNEFKNQLNNMLGDLHINVNSKHLSKYKQNLRIEGDYVISYQTKVAKICGNILKKIEWNVGGRTTSPTTSKHINYVAKELNLLVK